MLLIHRNQQMGVARWCVIFRLGVECWLGPCSASAVKTWLTQAPATHQTTSGCTENDP